MSKTITPMGKIICTWAQVMQRVGEKRSDLWRALAYSQSMEVLNGRIRLGYGPTMLCEVATVNRASRYLSRLVKQVSGEDCSVAALVLRG